VKQSKLGVLLAPGLVGLKRNLLPGLVLQSCALLIVIGYAFVPVFHDLLTNIGVLKTRYGYTYSALSTALFGGVIPFFILYATGKVQKGRVTFELLFYVGFWLWKGVEVDALYRLQSLAFGSEATVATIAAKAAVDQFVYGPFWAAPTQLLFFLWKESGFSRTTVRSRLKQESLGSRLSVIMLSSWIVWLPAVTIIYSLPNALQIPLFNLVLCFWCLLLSFVVRSTR
jgi:hypothetical protein